MRTLVLCYHSQNILGNDYAQNDHVALASDLQAILRRKLPVISFNTLLDYLNGRWKIYPRKAVVLTCDDGTYLDWRDYEHPQFGHQLSFDNILQNFLKQSPLRQSRKEVMTSFVIASPKAREQIDQGCYGGARLSTEDWWRDAANSGRWLFGNHSWDHRHICLSESVSDSELGQFYSVNNQTEADFQVLQASQYIAEKIPAKSISKVFAYPYGHSNDFLSRQYLPSLQPPHNIAAAVTTTAGITERNTNKFLIPRFTCGEHWQSPEQFESILDQL